MPTQRTFISFELPPEIREAVLEFRTRLYPYFDHARWEPPGKFHATIRFLGDTEEGLLPRIIDLIRVTASATGKFAITVSGFGAFPSMRRPRVLWIGCDNPDGRLRELHRGIENGLETLGFERDDRPFHPHVTIGRIRERQGSPYLTSAPKNITFAPHRTVVGEVFLMKSVLKPTGSEYTVLEAVPLG